MTQPGILYNGDRQDKTNYAGISVFAKRTNLASYCRHEACELT